MIVSSSVKIKVNPNIRKYYISKGYSCVNNEIIDVRTIDLSPGSNLRIDTECDNCKAKSSSIFNKYYKYTNSFKDNYYCKKCKKCNSEKAKKTRKERYGDENYTNIEKGRETKKKKYGNENYNNREKAKKTTNIKYGVNNVSEIDFVKQKKIKTSLEKYGVNNPFQSSIIKAKIENTCTIKYGTKHYLTSDDYKAKYETYCDSMGVKHYSQSDEFKDKFKETCLVKWGFSTNLLNDEIKNKIKKTNIERYGVDHCMKNKDISLLNSKSMIENRSDYFDSLGYTYLSYDFDKKLYELKNKDCGHKFQINYDLFRSRIKYSNNSCLKCYPKKDLVSIKEKEIVNWLKEFDIEIIENTRNIISPLELDIYLPKHNIAIEFNGLYYHSDKFKKKKYHINKTDRCEVEGIELIHVWEDDWINNKDIIKSIILNRLGFIKDKVFGRKCEIKEVSVKDSRNFLDSNHIQGYTNSSIKIGLYHNEDLVSLMTFGSRRTNNKKEYELIRFCNKLNLSVLGGSSKLFKHFVKHYKTSRVISYSDKSMFNGNMYKVLGFKDDGNTSLNYYWTDLSKRYHRFNFNKKKLVEKGYDESLTENEIMKSIGFYKIWSCGQIRWIIE
jgi:hypothetical protein